jgi:long-chain acyl-CoA synthetase
MLVEHLLKHAESSPDHIAIHDDAGPRTYRQLAAGAAGMSMHLASQTQARHVALALPSSAGFAASFYGALLAGKTVVPVNFLLSEREVAHVLADSGADTVVTIPQLAERFKAGGLKIIDITQLPRPTEPEQQAVFSRMLAHAAQHVPAKKPDDLAVLMYTSGTSGLPKGVMLTYGNLQSDVDACIELMVLRQDHVFLGVVPLFHAFGMTAMMLAPVQLGAKSVYMARFNPTAALNAIRDHKVSLGFAVPSMYGALAHLKSGTAEDFKSIYSLFSGGEPLSHALREKFKARFGVTLAEGYGLTETSPVAAMNTPYKNREGSVGTLVPGAEIRITDDDGNELPLGESGEIWLRGPMVMKGYYNLPKETAAALTPDGYFKTGDLGRVDPDGFIYITGRKKELIIIAGEKASPREIEEVLAQYPAVAEAAVVGKKDPTRGEVVVAFVIAREGMEVKADALRDFCREKGLAQWKIPREVIVQPDFPRSPTGKVLKRVLAEQVRAQPA